jgi:hypothetical protein
MMNKRNLPPISSADLKELMGHLIRDYPAHGFVISRDEARGLGLPVEDIENYPRHQEVKKLYGNFLRSGTSYEKVVADSTLNPPAPPVVPIAGGGNP